ncbi:MAG TPA: oligosaccharide flippase family protein [Fimbriimonadaceae bacterium]|nr:oligosaccharide flippase family protein [Fimbriimonadaceae bacterium]
MDRKAFGQGLFWTVTVNLINKAIFPLVFIVISRVLGPGPLGAFAILSTIVQVSEIFRDAGITQTFLADQELDEKKEGAYATFAILMALVPGLVLFFGRHWFAEALAMPELHVGLIVAAIALVFNGFATLPRAKLMREARMKELALIDFVSGGTGILLTLVLVFAGFAFWALVIQMVYCSAFTMILSRIKAPAAKPVWESHLISRTFKRSAALLGGNAVNNLFLMSDVFVIRKFLNGDALIGLFQQGKSIAYKPADFVTFPLTRMLIVAFSQAASDKEKLSRAFAKSIAATLLFVTPVYLFAGIASGPIVYLLLGPEFAGSAAVLSIMSIFLGFRTLGTIAGTAIVSVGKAKYTLGAQLVGLVPTVALLYFGRAFIFLPPLPSVDEYVRLRSDQTGAVSAERGPSATYYSDPVKRVSGNATWYVFTFADGSKGTELIDDTKSPISILDRDFKTEGYKGPTSMREVSGSDQVRHMPAYGQDRLERIVWAYTAGAATFYGLSLIIAGFMFGAPLAERRKIRIGLVLSTITGVVTFGLSKLPLPPIPSFFLLAFTVPFVHLALVGISLAGKPFACFSKSGLKRLWTEL